MNQQQQLLPQQRQQEPSQQQEPQQQKQPQQQQQQQQPSSQPQMNDDLKSSNEQTDEDDCQSNEGFFVKIRGLLWSTTADEIIKFLGTLDMLRANYNNYLTQIQVHRAVEKKTVKFVHPSPYYW